MSSSGYSGKRTKTPKLESTGSKNDSVLNQADILFNSNTASSVLSQKSQGQLKSENECSFSSSNQEPKNRRQKTSPPTSEDNSKLSKSSHRNQASSFDILASENSGSSLNSKELSNFMNTPKGFDSNFKIKKIEEIQSIRSEPRLPKTDDQSNTELSFSYSTESSINESEISQGDWKRRNIEAIRNNKAFSKKRNYEDGSISESKSTSQNTSLLESISESNQSKSSSKRPKRQVVKSSSSSASSQRSNRSSKACNFENVHSEVSDVPAVRKVKNKIENLLCKHEIDSPIKRQGVRIQYLDQSSPSPRKRQKVAPIFLDESEPEPSESEMSISSRIDVLTVERNAANITDSEISDIGLVDFDMPKHKFTKTKVKDALYSDSEAQFYYCNRDHIDNSESSVSLNLQSFKIETEDSDENITNDLFEKAQKQIEKYAIKDNGDTNGKLFNINLPDSDEEGQLLLDLKKNAIVLSSSDSQTLNEEEEDVEMIGNTFEHRNLRFFELSDLSTDGEEQDVAPSPEPTIQKSDDTESSECEIPLLVDKLIAPRFLVSPKSQKSPATPSPRPKYTDNHVLKITVLGGQNFPKANAKLKCEPYIVFTIKGKKDYKKTKTCRTGKKGVYSWDNEEISFVLSPNETTVLTMKIKDEDRFAGDIEVCSYEYLLSQLQVGQTIEKWVHLRAKKAQDNGGKLLLRLNLERELMPIPPHSPCKQQPFLYSQSEYSVNQYDDVNIEEEEEDNEPNQNNDEDEPSSTLLGFLNHNEDEALQEDHNNDEDEPSTLSGFHNQNEEEFIENNNEKETLQEDLNDENIQSLTLEESPKNDNDNIQEDGQLFISSEINNNEDLGTNASLDLDVDIEVENI